MIPLVGVSARCQTKTLLQEQPEKLFIVLWLLRERPACIQRATLKVLEGVAKAKKLKNPNVKNVCTNLIKVSATKGFHFQVSSAENMSWLQPWEKA